MSDRFEIIDYPIGSQDDRGWVIRPIFNKKNDFKEMDGDEGLGDVSNLHVVSIEPNIIRGNHFHKEQLEFLVVMGGLVEVVWQHPDEEEKTIKKVDTKSPVLLRVPQNVTHTIKNIGQDTVYVICYAKAPKLSGKDSYKIKDFHQ